MAKAKTNTTDPAVIAQQRMISAGENDARYLAAWKALVSAVATTPEGLGAKIAALRTFFNGDWILAAGIEEWVRLDQTIRLSVDRMMYWRAKGRRRMA